MLNGVACSTFRLNDGIGRLCDNIIDKWLLDIRETNPAILDMLKDRNVYPYRYLNPWSGEFAGKYLTSCFYVYKATMNKNLYDYVVGFIDEMLQYQEDNGYFGSFNESCQLTGKAPETGDPVYETWDAWSHYHIMFGLYQWYKLTNDSRYMDAIIKTADLFISLFYTGKQRLVDIGWSEMNLAPYHIFAILYRHTGEKKYLDFALEIEKDLSSEAAGNYISHSQNGLEFYQCPKPRWESLHVILGIVEMYRATGREMYLDVAKQIFYSIAKTDVHNTGGFSTDEQAIGHPFKNAAIETCCVIAYNALACDILSLTGDAGVADILELALYNAIAGSFSKSGRWSTYNTPMEGSRRANYHDIVFQSRPGSPDLNCCSVNAPRGIGMLSEWALMQDDDCIYINYFGSFHVETENQTIIDVTGDYPAFSHVDIKINSNGRQHRVAVRIPKWSANTLVSVNGETMQAEAGQYLYLERSWKGDTISIDFDFMPHFIQGEYDYKDKSSIYRGPVLFGFDNSLNPAIKFDDIPPLTLDEINSASIEHKKDDSIHMVLDHMGQKLVLCDFYSLGQGGSVYKTWLNII